MKKEVIAKEIDARKEIILFTKQQLEKPYVHGWRESDFFDCSGLTWYIYKELFNIDINENWIKKLVWSKNIASEKETTLKLINNVNKQLFR